MRAIAVPALFAAALAAVLVALIGTGGAGDRDPAPTLVLLDRSISVPRRTADAALARLRAAGAGDAFEVLEFAGGTGADLQPAATNLERAIDAALAVHARRPLRGLVIVSDGRATVGDAERALRAAADASLPVRWVAAARTAPRAWIADVLAPASARHGSVVPIVVPLAGDLRRPLRLAVTARSSSGGAQSRTMDVTGDAAPRVELEANAGGTLHVGVSLRDARTDELLDARRFAAAIEVSESGRILVLAGAGSTLAASLARAGWRVDERPVARADAHRERLAGYDAVALDDVAADDASEAFWHELAAQVRDRGTGLLVLGGERAFGRGGYRRSALESVLPVLSEPAALDRPAAVVFAVDKSGSMGEGSGGVNRLALAERAVIESVRTLGTRDRVSIVAFDAEARVLLPATPAADAAAAVQRAWGIDARGGTRLEPAVVRALDELDGAADGRRVLVLVTDGFADEGAPLDALRERLATAGIEVLALAVGADADAAALERLVAPGRGAVLRVAEAAELPQVMPAALERHRARVERGPLAVRVVETPPFLASAPSAWPSIDAYAVVRLRPGVTPWLESARGDPLLVGWRAGAGRVVAAPGGLGAWTRRWLAWEAWPAFASGLAAWVSGAVGPAVIAVTEDADGLIVDVDLPDAPPGSAAASLDFVSPSGRRGAVPLRVDAPGRLRGLVPSAEAGAWTLVASVGGATARTVHLRDARVEEEGWGVDPAVERWRAAGLVHDVGRPPPDRVLDRERSPDPRWLVAALVLAVAAIVVDRLPRGRAGGIAAVRERVRAIVRRTRSRSAA